MNEAEIYLLNILSEKSYNLDTEGITSLKQDDMKGSDIELNDGIIRNTKVLFPEVMKCIKGKMAEGSNKIVIAIGGGSGVGKSSIAYLLSFYLNRMGIGSYVLSGDNYPLRIPKYNDAERIRIFRSSGIQGMIKDGVYNEESAAEISMLQKENRDADLSLKGIYPWIASYISAGREALTGYLGTNLEIDFAEVSKIISEFKAGSSEIFLRRLGREDGELCYEKTDFSDKNIMILEWTHAGSSFIEGVDIPVLLNSTPEETLADRKKRNRDTMIDNPFVSMVLEIEQSKIREQAEHAAIILTRQGKLLSYEEYSRMMEGVNYNE